MLSNLSSNFLSPFSEKSFSLFSPLSSSILGVTKKGDKPMTLSNKFTLSLASLAVLGLLAACSNQTAQTPANSASSQQVSSSTSSSKGSQTASQADLEKAYHHFLSMVDERKRKALLRKVALGKQKG